VCCMLYVQLATDIGEELLDIKHNPISFSLSLRTCDCTYTGCAPLVARTPARPPTAAQPAFARAQSRVASLLRGRKQCPRPMVCALFASPAEGRWAGAAHQHTLRIAA
jgi:hypothetical protein